jgi:GH18 family chitinase
MNSRRLFLSASLVTGNDSKWTTTKLVMGVPLYGRGWTGVPDGGTHGRYQTATGPSPAYGYSQQAGDSSSTLLHNCHREIR